MKKTLLFAVTLILASLPVPAAQQARGSAETKTYFSTSPPTAILPIDPKLKQQLDEDRQKAASGAAANAAPLPTLDEPVARIENQKIPGPGGPVPVRIYVPKGSGPFPILVYIHGGGWVRGTLDQSDDVCRSLANRAGTLVISVDYRLAPDHKFPAAVDDSYAAFQWAAAHGSEVGGDPKRVAVGGASAGGNLAAAVALYARDKGGPRAVLQVLAYPVTNFNFDTASYYDNADGYGLTRDRMIFYWNAYLASPKDGENPYASPLRAKDLSGLPPALVMTAQYDPLRDDGESYAARLRQAGIPVHVTRYLDLAHGFLALAASYPQANKAVQEFADALRTAFAP